MDNGSNELKCMYVKIVFSLKIKKLKYFSFEEKVMNETEIMLGLFFLGLD